VELGPDPAARFANATERIYTNKNRSDGADHSENAEGDDPGWKAVNAIRVIGEREDRKPADIENDKDNADETNKEMEPAG